MKMINHKKRPLLLLILLILFSAPLLEAQDFQFEQIPDWVIPVNPEIESKVSKYDISAGVYNSLYDFQINLDEPSEFFHTTLNIMTNGGVKSASELYISYDTAYQEMKFHYLYIWRNGKKIDRTEELTFEVLNNEQELNNGIYTGLITAYDILEDIRVNDKIEYAYTIYGSNPIFENKGFLLTPMVDMNPIDYYYLRVLYPKNEKYYYNCKGCENGEMKEGTKGANKEIVIIKENIETFDMEETIPPWYVPYDYFMLTGYKDWKEVNIWAEKLFQLKEKPDLNEVFEEIFEGEETIDEKIDAILHYVQNDIRYMGIESGIGSIQPFMPDQVIKQRFGDCKDKSLLLTTLLKEIGVKKAYPALVNTGVQHGLDSLLPAGQMFDHCITYFEHENVGYWIDPSIPQQAGTYKTKKMASYGKALLVKKGETELVKMEVIDKESRTEIFEDIIISSFEKPGRIKVISKMYGQHADLIREVLEYSSLKDLSDQFRNTYAYIFPNIENKERLKIEDDVENNIITLVEEYTVSNVWRSEMQGMNSMWVFQYEPLSLYTYLNPMNCETKEHPVQVMHPTKCKQVTTLSLPEDLYVGNSDESQENEAYYYRKKMSKVGSRIVVMTYEFETKTKEISAADYPKMCSQTNLIAKDFPIMISYPKSLKLEAPDFKLFPPPPPPPPPPPSEKSKENIEVEEPEFESKPLDPKS